MSVGICNNVFPIGGTGNIVCGTYTTILSSGYSVINGTCNTISGYCSSTRMNCSYNKDYLSQIAMEKFGITEEDIHKDLSWVKAKIRDYNIDSIIG